MPQPQPNCTQPFQSTALRCACVVTAFWVGGKKKSASRVWHAEIHPSRARPFTLHHLPSFTLSHIFSTHPTLLSWAYWSIPRVVMDVCINMMCLNVSACVPKYVCSSTADRWNNKMFSWNVCWRSGFSLSLKMELPYRPEAMGLFTLALTFYFFFPLSVVLVISVLFSKKMNTTNYLTGICAF